MDTTSKHDIIPTFRGSEDNLDTTAQSSNSQEHQIIQFKSHRKTCSEMTQHVRI